MMEATVQIQLDDEAAQIYATASDETRKKIQLLLNFWLREFDMSSLSLKDLMDGISDNAQKRGMTPKLLEI